MPALMAASRSRRSSRSSPTELPALPGAPPCSVPLLLPLPALLLRLRPCCLAPAFFLRAGSSNAVSESESLADEHDCAAELEPDPPDPALAESPALEEDRPAMCMTGDAAPPAIATAATGMTTRAAVCSGGMEGEVRREAGDAMVDIEGETGSRLMLTAATALRPRGATLATCAKCATGSGWKGSMAGSAWAMVGACAASSMGTGPAPISRWLSV